MERVQCACGKWMGKYYFNSTIKRKQCPSCELQNKLSGSDIAVKEGLKAKSKGKHTASHDKTEKSKAMALADSWFSRYIRIKYSFKIQDGDVYCRCIANPSVIKHAKDMDNGHNQSRGHQATRYNENNCRPQSRKSNRFKGEMDKHKFDDNLIAEIGQDKFDEVVLMSRQTIMTSTEYFLDIANKYRKLTNKLVKQHHIKKWW